MLTICLRAPAATSTHYQNATNACPTHYHPSLLDKRRCIALHGAVRVLSGTIAQHQISYCATASDEVVGSAETGEGAEDAIDSVGPITMLGNLLCRRRRIGIMLV